MSSKLKLVSIVGARPQFIKVAALHRAIEWAGFIDHQVIHTGQHYDYNMSRMFFDELAIPEPRLNLGLKSELLDKMWLQLEDILREEKPDWVVVYGDTVSTLAGALAAVGNDIPVAHVEAGVRCFNIKVPEETIRVNVDRMSSLLFAPTETAVRNLTAAGMTKGVYNVGDVMYDSFLYNRPGDPPPPHLLEPDDYYLVTIHRAQNTGSDYLFLILEALRSLDQRIVLPLHPRTQEAAERDGLSLEGLDITHPLSYRAMLNFEMNANMILTDSGGVQKEAYWWGVPCVVLRDETEWPELVECGASKLVGHHPPAIHEAVDEFKKDGSHLPPGREGLFGTGHASEAIVETLLSTDPRPVAGGK